MALQDFARGVILINGKRVVLVESFDIEFESGQQPVMCLVEGLTGFTPGAGMTTLNLELNVPIGGPEFPIQKWVVEGTYTTIQQGLGPLAYVGNGKFTNCKVSGSTNQSTKLSCTWTGEISPYE
jgi:hypothetical protein